MTGRQWGLIGLAVLLAVVISSIATLSIMKGQMGSREARAEQIFVPNTELTLISFREVERDPQVGRLYLVQAGRKLRPNADAEHRASRLIPVTAVRFAQTNQEVPKGKMKIVDVEYEGAHYTVAVLNPLRRQPARVATKIKPDRGQNMAYSGSAR